MTRFLLAASLSLCAALAQADGIAQLKQFVHDTMRAVGALRRKPSAATSPCTSAAAGAATPGAFRWTTTRLMSS